MENFSDNIHTGMFLFGVCPNVRVEVIYRCEKHNSFTGTVSLWCESCCVSSAHILP